MNNPCQLADTGLNQIGILGICAAVFMLGAVLFYYSRRSPSRLRFLPMLIMTVTVMAVAAPMRAAHAAAVACGSGNTTSTPVQTVADGHLADDTLLLNNADDPDASVPFYRDFATSDILSNDTAPAGDPFDPATIKFVGDWPSYGSDSGSDYLIVDPSNPMPSTQSDTFPANTWGEWYADLDGSLVNTSEATPLHVYFTDQAGLGRSYTMQYTVQTVSGRTLGPATITVTVPPTPIVQTTPYSYRGPCFAWDDASFNFNIMANTTTTGTASILASSIDMDPFTPGRQTSATATTADGTVTFTVDGAGQVTITHTGSPSGRGYYYDAHYTIADSDGNTSLQTLLEYRSGSCT